MPPPTRRRKATRCSVPECTKQVQTRRLCKAHGGGVRCRGPDCKKLAQSRGLCVAHGGGRRCTFDGCNKLAQYGGFCLSHGGGRRCSVPECQKYVQLRGHCKAHLNLLEASKAARSPTTTDYPLDDIQSVLTNATSKVDVAFVKNRHTYAIAYPHIPHSPRRTPFQTAKTTSMLESFGAATTVHSYPGDFDGQFFFSIP